MLPTIPSRPRRQLSSLPEALNRHLSASAEGDVASISAYIDTGAALVDPAAQYALRQLRVPLHAKMEQLDDAAPLRRRLELLALFCDEAATEGASGSPAAREAAFALLYFLKGFDRVPDMLPEIGLLDDAMIVQIVVQRHAATLRAHWLRRRRSWPAEL